MTTSRAGSSIALRVAAKRMLRLPAVALLGLLIAGSELQAQSPEQPVWPYRHMAVGNVAFLNDWQPAVQAGYLFQPGLHRTGVGTGEFGEAVLIPVQWYLHALGSMGWTDDKDGTGDSGLSAVAQLGVIHRLRQDGPLSISRLGLAAQGSLAPRGIGPVARVEFFYGNAALSVGWMRFDGARSDGVVVSLDLLRCLFQDLGLVARCDVF